MRFSILLLILLPFAEIATFILVGKMIGVLAVLALTLGAMIGGATLLRIKGAHTLRHLAREAQAGRDVSRDLLHGALMVAAALLLIIPGFLTDILALLLLVPGVRDFAWHRLSPQVIFRAQGFSARPTPPADENQTAGNRETLIDLEPGDFERRDDRR